MTSGDPGGAPLLPVRHADILRVADVLDPAGSNPKTRPIVVLTPDVELSRGYPVVGAAVTGTFPPGPVPADYVVLPYMNPPGRPHPKTGLTKRAAAVCSWLLVIDPADAMLPPIGFVPDYVMAPIDAKTALAARALGGWP